MKELRGRVAASWRAYSAIVGEGSDHVLPVMSVRVSPLCMDG